MSTDIAESLPKRKFAPAPMVAKGSGKESKSAPPAAKGGGKEKRNIYNCKIFNGNQ